MEGKPQEQSKLKPNISKEERFIKKAHVTLLEKNIPSVSKAQIEAYLNDISPELLVAKEKLQYAIRLIDQGYDFSKIANEEEMRQLTEIVIMGSENILPSSKVKPNFKNQIASIRAVAIFVEKVLKKDPRTELKDLLLLEFARKFIEVGMEPPKFLHFLLARPMIELQKGKKKLQIKEGETSPEEESENQLHEIADNEIEGYIENGVHPKIAKRNVDTTVDLALEGIHSKFEQMRGLINNFLKDFPDPRVAVDLILGVKDDKLPI